MRNNQRELEQELRNQLVHEGSADAFSAAYDQFHNHVLEHGMWGKPTSGRLYRSKPGLIDALLLRLIPPRSSVLEIGVGDGVFAAACSSQDNNVVGLDISNVALQAARRSDTNGVTPHLLQGDARSLSFSDGSFQFAISRDLIEHLREQDVPAHLRGQACVATGREVPPLDSSSLAESLSWPSPQGIHDERSTRAVGSGRLRCQGDPFAPRSTWHLPGSQAGLMAIKNLLTPGSVHVFSQPI